jgi:hypothetical protein
MDATPRGVLSPLGNCNIVALVCRAVNLRRPAVLDCTDAINIFPAWSNSKDNSRLQFGYARVTSAICGSVNLILVVGFIALRISIGWRFTLD